MNFWKQLRRPIKVQAPMEEFTDASFRELLLRFGRPDVFYTEFVNCDGYCSAGRQAVEHRLQYSQAQHPIVAQIWGKLPENFYRTAAALQQLGFDGIDINLGCSVPKVLKNSLCAGLIKYPEQVVDIFNAVKKGAPHLPISIKTRIGYDCIDTQEWISLLLKLKPEAIVLHGRTAKQQLRGQSDWNEIARAVNLKDRLNPESIIIGNGDIRQPAELEKNASQFGVDGVMVGRAIILNPFFFARDGGDTTLLAASQQQKISFLLQHYKIFRNTWGDSKDIRIMRKFVKTYLFGFSGAAELRKQIITSTSYEEIIATLSNYC